jgi:hypothetical protein
MTTLESKSIGLSFQHQLFRKKKMVGITSYTEVAYGQATSNLEGYQFNNSGFLLGAVNQSFTAKDWSATWNSFIVRMETTEIQPSNHLTICHLV